MYIGVEQGTQIRHVSLVPWFDGLESLCGHPLTTTEFGSPVAVVQYANCRACRELVAASPPFSFERKSE